MYYNIGSYIIWFFRMLWMCLLHQELPLSTAIYLCRYQTKLAESFKLFKLSIFFSNNVILCICYKKHNKPIFCCSRRRSGTTFILRYFSRYTYVYSMYPRCRLSSTARLQRQTVLLYPLQCRTIYLQFPGIWMWMCLNSIGRLVGTSGYTRHVVNIIHLRWALVHTYITRSRNTIQYLHIVCYSLSRNLIQYKFRAFDRGLKSHRSRLFRRIFLMLFSFYFMDFNQTNIILQKHKKYD